MWVLLIYLLAPIIGVAAAEEFFKVNRQAHNSVQFLCEGANYPKSGVWGLFTATCSVQTEDQKQYFKFTVKKGMRAELEGILIIDGDVYKLGG